MSEKRVIDTPSTSSFNELTISKKTAEMLGSEGDCIKYYLMPTLCHISAVKIVTDIYMQRDILQKLRSVYTKPKKDGMLLQPVLEKIEGIVTPAISGKISALPLPLTFKKALQDLIQPVGIEIILWIDYHDECVFTPEGQHALEFLEHLQWSQRGAIDLEKTARALLMLPKNVLSDRCKYILACTYCIGDYITNNIVLGKRLARNLKAFDIVKQPMVLFWISHISGNFRELNLQISTYKKRTRFDFSSHYEFIFHLLLKGEYAGNPAPQHSVPVHAGNQVAMKYMWSKLNDQEKDRNCTIVIANAFHSDIVFFLLSQMDHKQQKRVFSDSECSKAIMDYLLNSIMWKDYLSPTMPHVLNSIDISRYLEIMKAIASKAYRNKKVRVHYQKIFKNSWQQAPKHLKEFTSKQYSNLLDILVYLSFEENIIRLILTDLDVFQRRDMIFSEEGMHVCTIFIVQDQWKLLELFMQYTLSTEKNLKESLLQFMGNCLHGRNQEYGIGEEWDTMLKILRWCTASEEELSNFRLQQANKFDVYWYFQSDLGILEIANVLRFCLGEKLDDFKANIFSENSTLESNGLEALHRWLLATPNFSKIDTFLHWCCSGDSKKMTDFKRDFYKNYSFIVESAAHFVCKNDKLKFLQIYIYWLFKTEEEYFQRYFLMKQEYSLWLLKTKEGNNKRFKYDMLQPKPIGEPHSVFTCLLFRNNAGQRKLKLAEEFLDWCSESSEMEKCKFKNKFLVYDVGSLISSHHFDQNYLEELVKWLCPSRETIVQFKQLYCSKINYPKEFVDLLDNFIQ